jgi:hypothetical protein
MEQLLAVVAVELDVQVQLDLLQMLEVLVVMVFKLQLMQLQLTMLVAAVVQVVELEELVDKVVVEMGTMILLPLKIKKMEPQILAAVEVLTMDLWVQLEEVV